MSSNLKNEISFYNSLANGKIDSSPFKTISLLDSPGRINCVDINEDGLDDFIVTSSLEDSSNINIYTNLTIEE